MNNEITNILKLHNINSKSVERYKKYIIAGNYNLELEPIINTLLDKIEDTKDIFVGLNKSIFETRNINLIKVRFGTILRLEFEDCLLHNKKVPSTQECIESNKDYLNINALEKSYECSLRNILLFIKSLKELETEV